MRAPAAVITACALCASCATETRVVKYRPALASLPGAETQTPVTALGVKAPEGAVVRPESLRVEQPDGSVRLISRTARQLMIHIYTTLEDNDEALFTSQVLSDMTRDEYLERGLDPAEAFRAIKARERDVRSLFNAMPMGETTPGLFLEPVGGGVWRLRTAGPIARELTWDGMDMVMERGNWRLRWFTTRDR